MGVPRGCVWARPQVQFFVRRAKKWAFLYSLFVISLRFVAEVLAKTIHHYRMSSGLSHYVEVPG